MSRRGTTWSLSDSLRVHVLFLSLSLSLYVFLEYFHRVSHRINENPVGQESISSGRNTAVGTRSERRPVEAIARDKREEEENAPPRLPVQFPSDGSLPATTVALRDSYSRLAGVRSWDCWESRPLQREGPSPVARQYKRLPRARDSLLSAFLPPFLVSPHRPGTLDTRYERIRRVHTRVHIPSRGTRGVSILTMITARCRLPSADATRFPSNKIFHNRERSVNESFKTL